MDFQPIIEAAREQVHAVMERDGMPGVAVSLLGGGAPVWTECFGAVDLVGARSIDPHTIFSLQSTSKTFTATAVMLAVQAGLLDLDAPITTYLPDFTVHSRDERNPQARMTLRHLLSHRAGFTHEAPLGGNFEPGLETASPNFEAHVASISDTWLRYPIGQRYAYSNLGIDLAGAILMSTCRAPFAECLERLIFEPLGMKDSTADAAVYGARENRAIGHQPGFSAVPVRIPLDASGGVYSSVFDMARFARFHLDRGRFEGRTVLDPALWDEMHTPSFDGFPYALGVLSLPLHLDRASPTLLNHNGSGYGFGSCFTYCPDHDLAWIALFNGQTRLGPPAPFDKIALFPALEARFGAPAPLDRSSKPSINQPRDALAPYIGTYIAGLGVMRMEWEGDVIGFRLPGDDTLNPLTFTEPNRAFVADGRRAPYGVEFHPADGIQPAWVQFDVEDVASYIAFLYGAAFDFNSRDDEPSAPIDQTYDRFLGEYRVIQWGVPIITLSLTKANDCLYLGPFKLSEHARGLLFTASGEAVDLTGDVPTFRNISLHRVGAVIERD